MNRKPLGQLTPVIEDFAASLTAKISELIEYDAIEKFADPLPQLVMAHILDLPQRVIPLLAELLADFTLVFDTATLDLYDKINRRIIGALDLLKASIVTAKAGTEESALTVIYDATSGPESQRLTDAASLTLFAYRVGAETTIGLLGLLIRTVIKQSKLRQAVRENPTVAPTVVSEVLRLESNVQRSSRICTVTREIGGKTIAAGDRLMLLLGAANRDPAAFAAPDSVQLDPRNVPDVAFGAGHHFCLGASLARLEGRIALEQFARLPEVEQAGEETWYSGRAVRRLTSLPVRVRRPVSSGL
jgi:cytochrome P450